MSQEFEQPETLAEFDRSFGGRKEQLVLEKSEFRDRPVYWLRLRWRNAAGEWWWSESKPSSSGRCFASLNIKGRELRELGLALVAEADELERQGVSPQPVTEPRPKRPPSSREQRAIDALDAAHPICKRSVDDDLPF